MCVWREATSPEEERRDGAVSRARFLPPMEEEEAVLAAAKRTTPDGERVGRGVSQERRHTA